MGHLASFASAPAGAYDIRRDGLGIRATAIASRKPVVHVGTASNPSIYAAVRYGFEIETMQWFELSAERHDLGETAVLVDANPATPAIEPVDIDAIPDEDAIGYAPIIWEQSNVYYVIGFQLIERDQQRLPNASPRLTDAWPTLQELPNDIRDAVLQRHAELLEDELEALARAPALVHALP